MPPGNQQMFLWPQEPQEDPFSCPLVSARCRCPGSSSVCRHKGAVKDPLEAGAILFRPPPQLTLPSHPHPQKKEDPPPS